MKLLRRVALAYTVAAAVVLILSMIGTGDVRDDRLGMIEIRGGRALVFARAGLIAGTAIEPGEVVVTWHASWSLDAAGMPRSWMDVLLDFHADGEDAECGAKILPLGIPVMAGALAMIALGQWKFGRVGGRSSSNSARSGLYRNVCAIGR